MYREHAEVSKHSNCDCLEYGNICFLKVFLVEYFLIQFQDSDNKRKDKASAFFKSQTLRPIKNGSKHP